MYPSILLVRRPNHDNRGFGVLRPVFTFYSQILPQGRGRPYVTGGVQKKAVKVTPKMFTFGGPGWGLGGLGGVLGGLGGVWVGWVGVGVPSCCQDWAYLVQRLYKSLYELM